ncbi:hydroxymethylbilane synthase [Pseudoflavonifractor phocaeensis]|uniref:hydroxymethylbilane synthase n=1 Tax=Pseudoflavonifractor phocaeensis TaxID=1870988 RepID=UPI001956B7FF|nr:hydroxymethylbilane synthase [Pseudoflavonifractor phocaeensis]MBM6869469.1 hydroxymethylbilane synthase [Pseudoflavonifractor phocaeensis]MBM6937670.1 hydroxymethylbilane synthase [Pseudoflavonifractor phocaeensis]
MKCIRVGSRESKLAVIQAEIAIAAIRRACPEAAVELVTMKTTGDKILDRTLDKVGGKGLFVKELDAALLEKRVDVTVHSGKDLPMDIDPKLPLTAFSRRADPRDVLVLPEGVTELDKSRPIGCASRRRAVQLAALFPEMEIQPVRGNVLTRLRKLDEGQYSALVLAAAGLERLGLTHRISRYFTTDEMIPAAGQGILAAQMRAGEDGGFLSAFADRDGRDCILAERAFVRALDGGCSSPVAAYATVEGETLHLTGMDVDEEDRPVIGHISGPRAEGEQLGQTLARRIRRREA